GWVASHGRDRRPSHGDDRSCRCRREDPARRHHVPQGACRGPQAARRDGRGRAHARGCREGRPGANPSIAFFMRLVEGEFPDYKQVIPSATRVRAQATRDDLLAALRRTSLMASERSHGVKMHLQSGTLELSASNPDAGEASEDLEVAYTGEPIII